MDSTTSILLVASGLILVMAEVFLPGGVAGTIGCIMALVGVIAGFIIDPLFGFILLVTALFGGIIAFWMWLKIFPKTPIGKRIILQSDAHEWHGFNTDNASLAGAEGSAHTPLHPSGIAIINGKRIDVVTRGEMIEKNANIKVLEVQGNRVIVGTL